MMTVGDDSLVECKSCDSDDEQINIPPPPPEFASKDSTPAPQTSTPPTTPATPATPTPSPTPTPTPTHPVDRDPNGINLHLKVHQSDMMVKCTRQLHSPSHQVEVKEVLSELTGPYSTDGVWTCSAVVFEKTRIWTYWFLSLLLAVPIAFLFGIVLAILASLHVWFLVPLIHLSKTFLPCLRSMCTCAVNVVVAPFCVSVALCCSQIVVSLSNKDCNRKTEKETV